MPIKNFRTREGGSVREPGVNSEAVVANNETIDKAMPVSSSRPAFLCR